MKRAFSLCAAALMLTLLLSNREVPHNVFLDDKIFTAMCQLTMCLCGTG